MKSPIQIPGETLNRSLFPSPSRPARSSSFLRYVVVAWILGGLALVTTKFWPTRPGPVPTTTARSPGTMSGVDDLVRHLNAINQRLADCAANLRRAEDQIDRAVPVLNSNYLPVESRRLKNAAAAANNARRAIEDSREEFQLVLSSIRKDDQKP